MKKACIKTLYHLFSFLSNCTNGFKPFVKYKLMLGALIIGFAANSCKPAPSEVTCYDPVPDVTCYVAPAPDDTAYSEEPTSEEL